MKETKLKINGMMCEGCENRVKSAVSLIEGVEKVDADHNTGIVTVTLKEEYPKITGVLIVAEGAENLIVNYKIQQATMSLLNIEADKIEILTMKV